MTPNGICVCRRHLQLTRKLNELRGVIGVQDDSLALQQGGNHSDTSFVPSAVVVDDAGYKDQLARYERHITQFRETRKKLLQKRSDDADAEIEAAKKRLQAKFKKDMDRSVQQLASDFKLKMQRTSGDHASARRSYEEQNKKFRARLKQLDFELQQVGSRRHALAQKWGVYESRIARLRQLQDQLRVSWRGSQTITSGRILDFFTALLNLRPQSGPLCSRSAQ